MEIVADRVEVTGPHGPLLRPTSLRARDGTVVLVTGDPGSGRTALALALSGRMKPARGTVRLDGSARTSLLRRRVAVVDAPDITAPDGVLALRDVVSEQLSIAGRASGRGTVRSWLAARDLADLASTRFEQIPSATRTEVLADLARAHRPVRALVFDCPDRHGGDPGSWHEIARRNADRGLAVVVLCSPHSAQRLGVASARVGQPEPRQSTSDSEDA